MARDPWARRLQGAATSLFTVHLAPGTGHIRGLWLEEQLRQLVASLTGSEITFPLGYG